MSTMSKTPAQIASKTSNVKPLSTMDDLKKLQKERAINQRAQQKQLKEQMESANNSSNQSPIAVQENRVSGSMLPNI